MPSLPHLPADVYYGDAETPLPDWRDSAMGAGGDDEAPTDAERRAVHAVLGFDPTEEPGADATPPARTPGRRRPRPAEDLDDPAARIEALNDPGGPA